MFFRKNRRPFRIRIDKEEAERERELFESEPLEVKSRLRLCKILMAVLMSFGAAISFLPDILVSLPLTFCAAGVSFVLFRLRAKADRKMCFVPPVCILAGFLMGQFLLKKTITTIMG